MLSSKIEYYSNFSTTHRQQPINEALLLLPVPPDPGHGLLVVGRVPVGVEHDEAVGPDEVQAAAPGLAGQHEDELGAGRIVELKVNV